MKRRRASRALRARYGHARITPLGMFTSAAQEGREAALIRPSEREAMVLAEQAARRTGHPHFVRVYLGSALVTNYRGAEPFVRVAPDGGMRRYGRVA
jgi:hypothetical protein